MSFGKIIKGLNFKQLFSLTVWFLKHPIFMICTVRATVLTFRISQREFPNIHGLHGKANAFRHALWNILIASKCHKIDKNLESVLNWTKEITDWHEYFSPNEELMRNMDLHNNRIGRDFYKSNLNNKLDDLERKLMSKLSDAVLVTSVEEIERIENDLVYLEE